MSLGPSDDPWLADDVGPPSFSPNPIPARQHYPHEHPHAIGNDNNNSKESITADSEQANTSTPIALLLPTGPSPRIRALSPFTSSCSQTSLRSASSDSLTFLPPRASIRTAQLELLTATRRFMDYLNDAGEYARTGYNSAAQTAGSVGRALTSKTAQRTLLTTVLFALGSVVLFAVACVGYLAFYHNFLPDQVISLPVHLQYG